MNNKCKTHVTTSIMTNFKTKAKERTREFMHREYNHIWP